MTAEELGKRFKERTALGSRQIKELPAHTNAPALLGNLPKYPSNDEYSLKANMRKIPAKAHGSTRDKVVCFDLQGPFDKSKHAGNRYVLNFYEYDDEGKRVEGSEAKKRQWHLGFLQTKDQFPDRLEEFLNSGDWSNHQFYCDNEAVLNSGKVKGLLKRKNCRTMRNSCEYEPWQNPAERPFQTLSAGSREFLHRGFGEVRDGFNQEAYWPYSHQQVADVHNASAQNGGDGRITHLRTPFCLAFARIPPSFRNGKLVPQAYKCMHLGYSTTKPGYCLEILEGARKGKVITSAQVKFRETVFPLRLSSDAPQPEKEEDAILWDDVDDDDDDDIMPALVDGSEVDSEEDYQNDAVSGPDGTDDDNDDDVDDDAEDGDDEEAPAQRRGRSAGGLEDWKSVFTAFDKGRAEGTINVLRTSTKDVSDPKWAPTHFSRIHKIADTNLRNEWARAHYDENDGLFEKPNVLRAVPLPPGVSETDLVHLHTLYNVKKDERKKARTVLGANEEALSRLNLNHGRTYSPTARNTTFRLLCAIATLEGLTIRGADVRQAYIYGDWPEWMKKVLSHMPAGYDKYYGNQLYCCEVGNLYGNPVAGRNWYNRLRRWTRENEYTQSQHDPCLFYKENEEGGRFYLIVYVDDIITFSSCDSMYEEFASAFAKDFEWTDFGTDLHDFLSVRITQTPDSVSLDMQKYIEEAADEFFPGGIHHAYTVPADKDLENVVYKAAVGKDVSYAGTDIGKRFRSILMKMLYATTQVRPDAMISVALLTRVQSWPNPDLLKRAERVLIYMVGTKELKLTYSKTDKKETSLHWAPRAVVKGASDSTFALAHSTSGYVYMLANAAISWVAKKQETIATSPYQAEIVAGSLAACDGVGIRGILGEVGHPPSEPTVLYMDNSASIDLAHDPVHHTKAKHIARKDLFIRELVENGVIKPVKIHTSKNVADAMTKPLEKQAFQGHRSTLLGLAIV